MSPEQNEPSPPPLCVNNCGFYGNSANKNLCSKCYRESLQGEGNSINLSKPLAMGSMATGHSLVSSPAVKSSDMNCCSLSSSTTTDSSCSSSTRVATTTSNSPSGDVDMGSQVRDCQRRTSDDQHSQEAESAVRVEPSNSGSATEHSEGVHLGTEDDVNSAVETQDAKSSEEGGIPAQVNSSRCWQCNKKVGLLGFRCRCGYNFCNTHRYADSHSCTFDYKGFDREQLRKQNNRVIADKLEKI